MIVLDIIRSLRESESPLLRVQVGPVALEAHRPKLVPRDAWWGVYVDEREYPEDPRYRRRVYLAPVPFVIVPLEVEVA